MHRMHSEKFFGGQKKLLNMDPKTPKNDDFWVKIKKKSKFFQPRIDVVIRFLSVLAVTMIFIFPMTHHRAKIVCYLALRSCLHTYDLPHLYGVLGAPYRKNCRKCVNIFSEPNSKLFLPNDGSLQRGRS